MNLVEQYVHELLAPALGRLSLPDSVVTIITNDITDRFCKVLNVWDNGCDRLSLLEFSREEATHYQPAASGLEIRMLVNACLRNSLIEDIHADTASTAALSPYPKAVNEAMIKTLTTEAILFFEKNWHKRPSLTSAGAYNFSATCPITYQAICAAGKLSHGRRDYPPVATARSGQLPAATNNAASERGSVVESGFDPRISNRLHQTIQWCAANKAPFLTPSFKHISRNIDKVYRVLEQLLAHDVPVLSPNYVLTNGMVLKRRGLLPPIHNCNELKRLLHNSKGLTPEHRTYLKAAR